MKPYLGALLMAALVGVAAEPASAQKAGGILKMYTPDSPASMSILEETTMFAQGPMMGVFNNLVMFDQHVKQNSLDSIVPDLAMGWSWNEDGTDLTLPLREDVKWHDGKPFTARDVECTWDLLLEKSHDKLRVNPRKSWYRNLERVTATGDYEVTFHLKRSQPAFLTLLASGFSPVYPCHVPARDMRSHPIGTGPFKFVEFKPNEYIKVARNPAYWKPRRPYLDGIEYTIIRDLSTAVLTFVAGKFDMTFRIPSRCAPKGRAEPGAAGDLQGAAGRHQPQPDRQPRQAAFRQPRSAPGDGNELGSQSIHRDPQRRNRRNRRSPAARAGRDLGHAAGSAKNLARL